MANRKTENPTVNALILCEKCLYEESGSWNIIGTLKIITVTALPYVHQRLAVFCDIARGSDDLELLTMLIISPSGNPVANGKLTVREWGELGAIASAWNLRDVIFAEVGDYVCGIYSSSGEVLCERILRVKLSDSRP